MKSLSTNNLFKNCIDATEDPHLCEKIKNDISNSKYYERIVVIVIDALRADFIPSISFNSEFNTTLPFTEALIKNKTAMSFIKKVHSPTVTMPRIRTLATGDISNFMDALTNLDASELNEDSILYQAQLNNLKSIFYGDETWLKLFPNLFIRSEGTHSFFVTDYQEVDTNVTRHLKLELSKKDWDIMILHYLGVDHIGHAYGPYSDLLPIKLKEMDEVIKYVYYELKRESEMQSLIVICGDHGMTAAGSHGGITKSELLTPLIFINTNSSEFHSKDSINMVDQVDFVPTLSRGIENYTLHLQFDKLYAFKRIQSTFLKIFNYKKENTEEVNNNDNNTPFARNTAASSNCINYEVACEVLVHSNNTPCYYPP
ncbi:GPI ethanolamine phosphate transferase 2 [Araneus ventricosus]|uniref:GPI ethanolamine phosphate transferase 2 n=1 Tax=Araneus ventricosus TaxID=182803 RepID=A0A4Y2HMX9_ARAVE|nr:GPI ethanolamine phosphate transferase 2 [Araneus ventricosus]